MLAGVTIAQACAEPDRRRGKKQRREGQKPPRSAALWPLGGAKPPPYEQM